MSQQTNKVSGGISDDKNLEDIANKHTMGVDIIQQELEQGIEIEMEHTNDEDVAREIAMDHLWEMGDYYSRLVNMEHDTIQESDTQTREWRKVQPLKDLRMPDGIYKGTQSGGHLNIGGQVIKINKTIRGMNVPRQIKFENGEVFIR